MPMNPNFLCCIGAELKNSTQQTTRMSQVYLYRAFEDDTLSDMLSAGFFNAAMGIIRQDDLLLLYSPNETTAKYTYARVSSVSSSGVVIERVGIEATSISVDTTGYSNISGNNLQEIINSIDSEFSKYVKLDGTSIMTGPLKIRAGSMQGAIAAYWDGVGFFKLNSNDSVTLLASMEATDGLCPATNNTYNLGKTNYKWKDAYIARVITAVINNGYDIAVPVTNGPDTLALKSEVDTAANSGRMITDTGVWFAKMYAASTVPTGVEYEGTNYADFSQVDSDNNPIIVIYEYQSGSWVETERVTPPANYDGYVPVTKKMWDIIEQTGQQGGRVLWNHQSKEFTPYPNIVDLSNVATTDLDNLTDTGKNIANWSSNVTNCITEIPQDIKLELNAGTLTLKAGSKCYLKTDTTTPSVNIASDLTTTQTTDGTYFAIYNGSALTTVLKTTYNYSSLPSTYSLPLAVVTVSGGAISSIDQVFNGLGYIGTAIFILPGISALIPNGLNPDGSCKNIAFTNPSVYVYDTPTTVERNIGFILDSSGNIINNENSRTENTFVGLAQNRPATVASTQNSWWYSTDENQWYNTSGSTTANWQKAYVAFLGKRDGTATLTTYFENKSAFSAADRNDREFFAHQAMPSNKVIDLTVGASGTTYTAPADGYFTVKATLSSSSGYVELSADVQGFGSRGSASGCYCFIPCRKGRNCILTYSSATVDSIKFTYANGAK